MNILYITSYPIEYNTSANMRNLGLIAGLLKEGHNVSTFSPYPLNKAFYSGELTRLPLKKRYWIGSVGTEDDSENKGKKPGKIKKTLETLYNTLAIYDRRSWLTKLINCHSVEEDFDIIISSSDPKSAHLLAESLIRKRPSVCKKWIQYWGDPFFGDITNRSLFKSFLVKREERRILKQANKAVYVSPFTAEDVKARISEISQNIQFLPIPFIEKSFEQESLNENCQLISYFGDYYSRIRNISPLVTAINELKVPSAIVGNSDFKIEEQEYLTVRERMNSKDLQELANKTWVYVCLCNRHGTQIPGKIYHNVATGKPILIILDGNNTDKMRHFFESFKRFYICNNDVEDIISTLLIIRKEKKVFDVPESLKPENIANQFVTL